MYIHVYIHIYIYIHILRLISSHLLPLRDSLPSCPPTYARLYAITTHSFITRRVVPKGNRESKTVLDPEFLNGAL